MNNRQTRTTLLRLAVAAILYAASSAIAHATEDCPTAPSTDITPQEVVKTVVDALRDNDEANNGIATVFCFASPGNKSNTGPLARFTAMIKRGFGEMLNHSYSHFDEMQIKNDTAMQAAWLVTPDGREFGYMFTIGKQKDGEYANMWMTEGVFPLRRPGGNQGLGI